MFGRGLIKLQPAYVEDVAEAVGGAMRRAETPSTIFEFGGSRVYSYEVFLRRTNAICGDGGSNRRGRRRRRHH